MYTRKRLWRERPHYCENLDCPMGHRELTPAMYEVGHVIDIQHGGNDDNGNVLVLCRNCHGMFEGEGRLNTQYGTAVHNVGWASRN